MNAQTRTKGWMFSRDARLVLFANGLQGFAFSGLYGSLFNLYLLRLGWGTEFIGLILGAGGLSWALAGLPGGAFARRFGLRGPMILGMGFFTVGLILTALTGQLPPSWQAGWVLVTYVLALFGGGFCNASFSPALMAFSREETCDALFSVRQAMLGFAGFAGSLFGGWLPGWWAARAQTSLDQPAPYRWALFVGAFVCLPAIWALAATRPVAVEAPARPAGQRARVPYGVLIPLSLVTLLRLLGEFGVRNFFNVYLDAGLEVSTAQIGTWMGVAQLLAAPAALIAPVLTARWGHEQALIVTVLGTGLSILPLALIPQTASAGLGFVAMSVLANVARPAITVYGQRLTSPAWRPVISGAVSMVAGLGSATMSLAGGYVIGSMGYRSFFLINMVSIIAGAFLFWRAFGQEEERRSVDPSLVPETEP